MGTNDPTPCEARTQFTPQLVELLIRLEWSGEGYTCPECRVCQLHWHETNCPLAQAIDDGIAYFTARGVHLERRRLSDIQRRYVDARRAFDATEAGKLSHAASAKRHRDYRGLVDEARARGGPFPRMGTGG